MRHHLNRPDFKFVKVPVEFSRTSKKDLLQYCLGATLYMPATLNMAKKIINKRMPGLTSIAICFEDALPEDALPDAEKVLIDVLEDISKALDSAQITENDLPLLLIRVRNPKQFMNLTKKLTQPYIKLITGFIFPKFSCTNGNAYMGHLEALNHTHEDTIYGLPIIESKEVAFKESRLNELMGIKYILKPFRKYILNVRVGGTDLSSIFGVRRGRNHPIYDILPVRDCLSDIINLLGRPNDGYVISGPVWEYFLPENKIKLTRNRKNNLQRSILEGTLIENEAVSGLLKEVMLDRLNGFVGKSIIHPSQLKYVNAMQAVTQEEYEDAVQIMAQSGGVIKSTYSNKMNEFVTHRHWASKIINRAKAFGVIEDEGAYAELF